MLRPYLYVVLNSQQFGRTSFRQRLELVARPEGRPTRNLAHEPVADPGLAREALNVRLGGKEAVRAALHDEAARSLGDGDAAGSPFRFEHDDLGTRARERPGRGQTREPRPHHRDRYSHPRPAAVLCASSATAPTSNGSSFSEGVRSSCTPSRCASSRYTTSTSYSTSTWSHTNPMGTMRNARWPLPARSVMTAPASGPSHGSAVAPALWYATCQWATPQRVATAAALARS